MKQRTLAMMTGFEQYTRKTRRAIFLEEMEQVVPWRELCALVAPHYPKAGQGRTPVGVERMLRIYFLQQWFNLSDPAVEEALYDSAALRSFVDIDLGREPVPDETTCASSGTYSKSISWAGVSSSGWRSTYKGEGCGSARERSWMRRLCMHRGRPRTRARSVDRKSV